MRYAPLPGTSKPASLIALGTAWFGSEIPEDQAFRLMDEFRDRGGSLLDSAHMYFKWREGGEGKSESTIGKWLRRVPRGDVLIGTKGADMGMDRATIRAQLAESLDRLGTDYVDFYWLHCDDPAVPAGDIILWLNELVDEGLCSAFGCSNWRVARIREAAQFAEARGVRPFAASQIGWSLAQANPEIVAGAGQVFMDDETLAYHLDSKLPIVAYSSQAGGFFAGAYAQGGPPPGMTAKENVVRVFGSEGNYARQAAVNRLAAEKGCTPNQIAVAYLLCQPFGAFALVGANSLERMADSCGAADVVLSPEEVAALEQA